MASSTVQVEGLREFLRATSKAEKDVKKKIRARFRTVGDIVKRDATGRFMRTDPRSAAGYRTVVRARGVEVEQRLRKTTGKRPDFGALQMRTALVPALQENERVIVGEFGKALRELADEFG